VLRIGDAYPGSCFSSITDLESINKKDEGWDYFIFENVKGKICINCQRIFNPQKLLVSRKKLITDLDPGVKKNHRNLDPVMSSLPLKKQP
jgi:hypothetical protein